MAARRGVAPVYLVIIVAVLIVVGVGFRSVFQTGAPDELNETNVETQTSQNTTDTGSSVITKYVVEAISLDEETVPAGYPLEVKVQLAKVSGNDPFEVDLSVSGEVYETRLVNFGEAPRIEVIFTVNITRQGRYEAHMGSERALFEVQVMSPDVEWVNVSPKYAEQGENVTARVGVRNPNWVPIKESVWVELSPNYFHYNVSLKARESKTVYIDVTQEHYGFYTINVDGVEDTFNVSMTQAEEPSYGPPVERPFVYESINYIPDPLTWNMTSILPPNASPVRLSLPVPIDSLYGPRWSGIGGLGVHAGGHIEGLDHVWIESTTTEPIKSWADGNVTQIQLSGDVDAGEYHITVQYGQNLTGIHMEIETPLVEVGDSIMRGDPVGYGMVWFDGLQSAEHTLIDRGRRDGIKAGDGVMVSPFDYLVEEERIALAEAYIENVVEPYMGKGQERGMFDPAQPYFTNNLMIHEGHEGKLQGEWYLISANWSPVYPNDLITIIEPDNEYSDQARILGNDDQNPEGVSWWRIRSDLHIDYENGRLWFRDWNEEKMYGIFEVDESGERATLRLEYKTGGYPTGFSDEAQLYIERTYVGRRQDAVEMGVTSYP